MLNSCHRLPSSDIWHGINITVLKYILKIMKYVFYILKIEIEYRYILRVLCPIKITFFKFLKTVIKNIVSKHI